MSRVRHSLLLAVPAATLAILPDDASDKKVLEANLSPSARSWKMIEAVLPSLVSSIILGGFAYYLTGRVEESLKLRQATVAGVQAMTPLLERLADSNLSEADRRVPMRQLTMYGVDAIAPVITLSLTAGLPVGLSNDGLALLAVHHHDEVCGALRQVSGFGRTMWAKTLQLEALLELPSKLNCANG